MYKIGESVIKEGLSPFSRFVLGFFSGIFGVLMIVFPSPAEKAIYSNLFGGFCLLICFACIFKGKVRQFLGSCIGVCLFVIALGYLIHELIGGKLISGSRSEPSVVNAIAFLIFFGIPGITYTLKVKFGSSNKKP